MNKQELSVTQKDISDIVVGRLSALQSEGLKLPKNYSPQNALKSAFFELTNSSNGNLIEKCDKTSVANSLLDMVIQGLNPSKKQCYFIPYGTKCILQRSYFGTVAVAKELANIEIVASVIYVGDEFEIENVNGVETIKHHKTSWKNRDNEIEGAYAIITDEKGNQYVTIMTKKEIDISWKKAKTKNVHNDFPQEMAKRTVINRACKMFINTSNDSGIISEAFNRTTSEEYENKDTLNDKIEELKTDLEENQAKEIDLAEFEEFEETTVDNAIEF